jgi:hypothetical protein
MTMGLGLSPESIKDLGLLQSPAKSTMSDGNAKRGYHVFEKLYQELIKHYRSVYTRTPGYKVIDEIRGKNIKIIDATTMSVCLNLIAGQNFGQLKAGSKRM